MVCDEDDQGVKDYRKLQPGEAVREEWRKIPGWDFYLASNLGRIKSTKTQGGHPGETLLKQWSDSRGYMQVSLSQGKRLDGRRNKKRLSAHRLVLLAFCGEPSAEQEECRHLNGDKADNRLCNLSWGTRKENAADKARHGAVPIGERNSSAKLTREDVVMVRERLSAGASQRVVAAQFGVSRSCIRFIQKGETWRHV